jgi:hypothetical protein
MDILPVNSGTKCQIHLERKRNEARKGHKKSKTYLEKGKKPKER